MILSEVIQRLSKCDPNIEVDLLAGTTTNHYPMDEYLEKVGRPIVPSNTLTILIDCILPTV